MKTLNPEIAKKLKADYESGISCNKLTEMYGLSLHYVNLMLRMQGIKPRNGKRGRSAMIPSSETMIKRIEAEQKKLAIVRLYESGKTFDEIGQLFGCSRQNIFSLFQSGGQA